MGENQKHARQKNPVDGRGESGMNDLREYIYNTFSVMCYDCWLSEHSGQERRRYFAKRLSEKGWRVIDGRVLCPECAKKGKGDENRSA
jgi:hypothetical protein